MRILPSRARLAGLGLAVATATIIGLAISILLDLSNPVFLDEFLSLDKSELARIVKALKKIRSMDWDTFTRHRGSRWEEIHILAPNGKSAHSFRLSQKYRALAYRDGEYLRVLSLHLDRDSAYSGKPRPG